MSEALFGRIIHAGQVEAAVRDTLQTWLSTYLAEVERQSGLEKGKILRPRKWVRTADGESLGKQDTPCVAIESAGWADEPSWDSGDLDDGRDKMAATWAVSVIVYVRDTDRDFTLDAARIYAAAVRQTLLGKPSLGDFAQDTRVVDEDYGPIDATRERTLAGGEVVALVDVGDVATRAGGPDQPEPEPEPPEVPDYPTYPDPPTAETVDITVTHIDEEA